MNYVTTLLTSPCVHQSSATSVPAVPAPQRDDKTPPTSLYTWYLVLNKRAQRGLQNQSLLLSLSSSEQCAPLGTSRQT